MTMHHSTKDVEHFDRWAPTYDAFWGQRYVDRIHQFMLDAVSDAGCSARQPRPRRPSKPS